MPSTASRGASVQRILVTRLRFLGDVVTSTPVIATLRERFPSARLEYLTFDRFEPALRGHPALDRVLTLPWRAGPRATLSLVRELRRPRIDWYFDLFGNPRSALIAALAAPRHSVGPRRGLRALAYEHRHRDPSGGTSAVRGHLDKLKPLLGDVPTRPTLLCVEPGEGTAILKRLDLKPDDDLVLFHPGATWPDRAWPLDRWPELAALIRRRRPAARIRLITQPGAESEVVALAERCGADALALPVLELRGLLALVSRASLYVGNDGGILHSAVALRVPTVGLLGPTDDRVWFPYEEWGPYRVVRRDSGGRVHERRATESRLKSIGADEVAEAAAEVLAAADRD